MKSRAIKYLSLLLLIYITGCAYFNMYYNGRESYQKAEEKRKKNGLIDKGLYENSIKELSKILEFYPDSKWVDDALLLMGLSYLRQEEYYKARRKFEELITNFPESELFDRAKIRLAEVEIALKNFDKASLLIENIKTGNLELEKYEILKLNSEMSLSIGDSAKSLDFLNQALNEAGEKAVKLELAQKASGLALEIKDYRRAASLFKLLIGLSEKRQDVFDNTLKYSQALNSLGKTDSAVTILEEILSLEEFDEYSLSGDVTLAKYYLDGKNDQKTFDRLDEILRTNEKNRKNGGLLSEAAYYFGEYYFNIKKDMEKAVLMYDSSGYYDRKNDSYQKAYNKRKQIREYNRLARSLSKMTSDIDSIYSSIKELKNMPLPEEDADSTDTDPQTEIDRLKDILNNKKEEMIAQKLVFSEKSISEMGLKDTAEVLLREIIYEKDYPHRSSKAMLMLYSLDSVRYADLKDSILTIYPKTKASNYIRFLKGIEPVNVIEDSASYLFDIASEKYLDSLYSEAFNEYVGIAERFPESPEAPKILKAAGLIAEKHLKEYEKAEKIYKSIKEVHPGSEAARFANLKLREPGEQIVSSDDENEMIIDEDDKWYYMDRRNE